MKPVTSDCQSAARQEGEANRLRVTLPAGALAGVPGELLEAVYAISGGGFLIVSLDCPYEASLHFSLTDTAGRILASKSLEAPYTTGTFRDATPLEDTLEFSFYAGDRWRLRVLPAQGGVFDSIRTAVFGRLSLEKLS